MSEPKYVNLDTVSIACRMRTGPNNKKSQKSNISYIWVKAPRKDIAMKFGTGVDVLEIVTWAEFDLENLRGVNFTGG